WRICRPADAACGSMFQLAWFTADHTPEKSGWPPTRGKPATALPEAPFAAGAAPLAAAGFAAALAGAAACANAPPAIARLTAPHSAILNIVLFMCLPPADLRRILSVSRG